MKWQEMSKSGRATVAVSAFAGLLGVLLIGFSLVYSGKIYPGVSVNGIYMGGLSKSEAIERLEKETERYRSKQIAVKYNNTTLHVPLNGLKLEYQEQGVKNAFLYGRSGSIPELLKNRLRAIAGRPATYEHYSFDDEALAGVLGQIDSDVTTPVSNASLSFANGQVTASPSHPGMRFDRGLLLLTLRQRFTEMSDGQIQAMVYEIRPTINAEALNGAKKQAEELASRPVVVTASTKTETVGEDQILSWLDVTTPGGRSDIPIDRLKSFYPNVNVPVINISLNPTKVGVFVSELAGSINQQPENAELAMQDGKLIVTRPSHDGLTLDQQKATNQLIAAVTSKTSDRNITVATAVKKAEVNEGNLEELGIKEQLSHGQTFFPGSTKDRMTNVRVGTALYDGVLLKPGEVFSFGKILGDVGPAQGYVPELVILGDHEEKQYGGGLCQVASTAYRAALLAGLPILERHNHSFAVSYYTAPYGVPGIDATIYYPAVDFKFKNDTGHYMLIQTRMEGTTLTFDYFGTKTKYGEIRGPQFISGTTDTKQPSHTVFWRDIKGIDGTVIKTDEIHTHYESSERFPIQKQFN